MSNPETADSNPLALETISSASELTSLLSTLFEPSQPLHSLLVPSVLLRLTARTTPPESYNELIDICEQVSKDWTWDEKAEFLSGHPMIGEVKGLSKLSGKEQGGSTPKIVLDRLAHLNALYCKIFPGLRFITFVNSRPRSDIIPELEGTLNLPLSPEPIPESPDSGYNPTQPSLESKEVQSRIKEPSSEEWKAECERGLGDVWRIGRARLGTLGLK